MPIYDAIPLFQKQMAIKQEEILLENNPQNDYTKTILKPETYEKYF